MEEATFVQGFHDAQAVATMTYHPLGNTGLRVSRLSLGGGPLGGLYGEATEAERVATVRLALTSGVNYIDTAPWYGDGRSEQLLGKALKDVPRSAYYIATKVGRYSPDPLKMFNFSADHVEANFYRSLSLLGLDYVDVLQVHDLEFAEDLSTVLEETLPVLEKMVRLGKARFIGITGYPVSVLKEVVERSKVKVDMVLSYCRNTLFDDTLSHYMPFFQERGVGVVNACAVAMGLLCDAPLVPWHPAPQVIKDACHAASQHCREAGVDLARLAVQHSLKLPGVATHLMGNDNQEVLRRNLHNVLTPPTPHEETVTKQLLEKFFKPLPIQHWEGGYVKKHHATVKQLREAAGSHAACS